MATLATGTGALKTTAAVMTMTISTQALTVAHVEVEALVVKPSRTGLRVTSAVAIAKTLATTGSATPTVMAAKIQLGTIATGMILTAQICAMMSMVTKHPVAEKVETQLTTEWQARLSKIGSTATLPRTVSATTTSISTRGTTTATT